MAILAEKPTEAQAACRGLEAGEAAMWLVDQKGETVQCRPATTRLLAACIPDLERQIAGLTRPSAIRFATPKSRSRKPGFTPATASPSQPCRRFLGRSRPGR